MIQYTLHLVKKFFFIPIFKCIIFFIRRDPLRKHFIAALITPEEGIFLSLRERGYLVNTGWKKSVIEQLPVDANGEAIPWYTYPFIHFIDGRLKNYFHVFEYGSGYSTLYFSKIVKSVTSVEHDISWFNHLRSLVPHNVLLEYRHLDYNGRYCRTIENFDKKYHVISIDGRDRVNCIIRSLPFLLKSGVLILDNSERLSYSDGVKHLYEAGFRSITFQGLSPIKSEITTTAIFYRNENVFDI